MNEHPKNPVHVLHVVPGLLPAGMELTMARVISALTGDGMRHSVVCLKGEAEIADRIPGSTDIHCLHSRPNELRLPARLAGLIRQIRPTVIHARNWGAWPDIAVARLLARPVVPLILSFHGLGKAGYMPLRRRLASWVLARMATSLVTVSNQSKEMMVADWGWPRNKIEVIPNGVDTSRFCRNRQSHDAGCIVVGTVGNLRPVKNHVLLVQSCGRLINQGQNLEIRIAGEGEERQPLVALANSLGIADRLKLVGRIEDVPGFLHGLDIFVLSSDSEQHPNALNEAMSCGLGCVATRVGCVDELLDEGLCGKIVSPGEVRQMANAIAELAENPEIRQRFGELARQRVCQQYSLKKMLDSYRELYGRLSRRGLACV